MYYGDEKALQMSRSLLPSTARKSAREEKKLIARRKRRKVKQALHKITCEDDYYEDNLGFDYHFDAKWERSYMVRDRQSADKIGPFINWAKEKAKHIPDGEKLDYIRGILPGSGFIIIDHALSHLEYVEGFERNPYSWRRWYWGNRDRKEIRRNDVIEALKEISKNRKLIEILNALIRRLHSKTYWYRHKKTEVNRVKVYKTIDGERVQTGVKEEVRNYYHSYDKTTGPRLLMGNFDVEDFFGDIEFAARADKLIWADGNFCHSDGEAYVNNPQYHPEWKRAIKVFVDAWMDNPNNFEKLKSLPELDYFDRTYYYSKKSPKSYTWSRVHSWKW